MHSHPPIPPTTLADAQAPLRPVKERALIRRINRVLAKENKVLRLCRFISQWFSTLGRYYQVDLVSNLGGWWFDRASELEAYAREIQVLAPSEYLAI